MKIGSDRILFALIVGCNILLSEASIFDVHRHVANFVRRLWGISEEETEEAINNRHSEPIMERNVFGHADVPSPPTSSPPITAAPIVITPVTAAPSSGGIATLVPSIATQAPTVGTSTSAPTPLGGVGTVAPTIVSVTTTAPTVPGLVSLAPTVAGNGSATVAPSTAASSTTLSPTITGGGEVITSYLELNVSPGGELRIAGTAQNNALNSVVENFGSLDPADPASALVLTNAYSLNTIYHSCGGSLWFMNTNWNSAAPPCDAAAPWFGVTCDATGGVTNITLSGNDAVGNLPSEIRALTALCKLAIALLGFCLFST